MSKEIAIAGRPIGIGHPAYIIAEMSANHNRDFDEAVHIVEAAKAAGADAIKLQTYTADTLTMNANNEHFLLRDTIWRGRTLHELYGSAFTPWDWQPKLKLVADRMGITLFSSPFDETAVDFLAAMDVPAYKIASMENVDLPLLRKVARTGKPIILSTGMSTLAEIDEAVTTIRMSGGSELALLKCNSSYPALPEEINLRTIPHMAEAFGVPVGLSDHTRDVAVAIAAIALGAALIEVHFTLSRDTPGPDVAFSLEPQEFRMMVNAVRTVEKAMGRVFYGVTAHEAASTVFKRSLFVVEDVRAGEPFSTANVRSIRPSNGLHTRHLQDILGRHAIRDIARGTPISWDLVGG